MIIYIVSAAVFTLIIVFIASLRAYRDESPRSAELSSLATEQSRNSTGRVESRSTRASAEISRAFCLERPEPLTERLFQAPRDN